ncbi:MAG: ABC transporter ATP-binding protein [Clostridium chrysemydis]|uniref:ABC transporter ATP-binding protein n=1 Tax=Clostridium chrysemydis TaxID=2665504 RepID=UPI003F3DBDCE
MVQISLKNVIKIYGTGESKTIALRSLNLDISAGELVAIMGPSGSGKSTLLNILGCIDIPTEGQYLLDSQDIAKLNSNNLSEIRNKKIGFIFQNFNLLYDHNLIDNVGLPLTYSKNKQNIKKRSKDILTELGLENHIYKTPDKLSGGQKQRVAIARALVNNPEIILADEPTGALDQETGENIMNLLKSINEKGTTVIIITHDINIANQCNKVINLLDGSIID